MGKKSRLVMSVLISYFGIFASFVLPIVPCVESPNVPNPIKIWKFKSLGYVGSSHTIIEYFGITESLTTVFLIISISLFALSFLILSLINKKRKKKTV